MGKNQSKNILPKIFVNNNDAKFFQKKLLILDWFKQISMRRKVIIALVVLEILFLTGILGIDLWLIIGRERHQLENQVESDLELVEISARTDIKNQDFEIPNTSDNQAIFYQQTLAILTFRNGGYSAIYSPSKTGGFILEAAQNETESSGFLSNKTAPKNFLNSNVNPREQEQLKISNYQISDNFLLNKALVAAGKPIIHRIQINNQTYTVAAKSINNDGGEPIAVLVRGIPESLIKNLIGEQLILKIPLFMVLIVIQIILLIILDKTMNNSLLKLKTIAQDFALGNWQKRAIVNRQDEIGELAFIFNQIADRIVNTLNQGETSSEELKNINLELQQKITDCQQTKVEFKQNQAMLSAIIDNSTAVIYVQDIQGKYLLVNRKFEELFNLKKAQIIGKNDYEIFPKTVVENFQKIHQIVIEAKRPLTVEELLPDKDGYHSYVSIKFPLDDLDGVPYAIGSISTNINYRKELQILLANVNEELENKVAERTAFLRQANELLRIEIAAKVQANKTARKMTEELAQHARTVDGILNASVDLIYLFDLSGKYTYVSRTGAEILGIKPGDLIGKMAKDLGFSQEIIQQFDEQIKTVLTTNKYVKSEGCFPTVKGVRNYEYILSPVCDEKGNIEAVVSTFRDITERKHTQLELEFAKEAAEAANQAKSAFLANISHELKTPLNAIIGYSDLLNEEIIDLGYQDFISDLNKIRSESQNLLHKIQEIIDFAKIEANKMKLYLEDFHLSSLVNDVVKSVQPLVVKNGNILMVDGVEDIGIMYADPSLVKTIISNLLSNAAKFTYEGEISLKVSRQRDKIVFSVTDNGIGMSLDQIKYLFQPFTQADESTTRQYEGTGLGLAISQRLCQLMGGKITVDSKVGSGSTFTVCLPVEVQESQSKDFLETKEYES